MVHLSGVVGTIAAVPAIVAWSCRRVLPLPAALVLWHVAGAGFAVSLATRSEWLASRTTWMLGKRADGSISALGLLAFAPYHAGLRAKLALQRRFSSEPAWNLVAGQLYIGAWPSGPALVPTAQLAVLDVTAELPLQVAPPAYKRIAVWDTHSPSPAQIDEGVAWSLEQIGAGRGVLTHCAHGHGRSATMLGAILIAQGTAEGVDDAEALMQAARPRVRLNRRQRAALEAWAGGREKAA